MHRYMLIRIHICALTSPPMHMHTHPTAYNLLEYEELISFERVLQDNM